MAASRSPHLSADDFFQKLATLFSTRNTKNHGSIYLTQKRLTWTPETSLTPPTTPSTTSDDFSDLNVSKPLPVIIHATDGKGKRAKTAKVKLSTVVQPDDLETFFAKYADVCKSGMTGALKKRDRKGRKAKKKKGGAAGTVEKA